MSDRISDILERAADLIEPAGAWCQQTMARDRSGRDLCDGYDPEAVCWCGIGAVEKVLGTDAFTLSEHPANVFLNALVGKDFETWNDAPERTQAEVVAKLREAAAKAREQGR